MTDTHRRVAKEVLDRVADENEALRRRVRVLEAQLAGVVAAVREHAAAYENFIERGTNGAEVSLTRRDMFKLVSKEG